MTLTRLVDVRGLLRPDPEVTIGVFLASSFVKALSRRDPAGFDRIDLTDLAPGLDHFLSLRLSNLNEQRYRVEPG